MAGSTYSPTVGEIRRYTQEALHSVNRLANHLYPEPAACAYLAAIRSELTAVLCNLDLAGSTLTPKGDKPCQL
jgi:hypothetical protein